MVQVIVRPVTVADHVEWLRMRRALWPECPDDRHRLEMWHLTEAATDHAVFIALLNDKPIGFAEFLVRHDPVEGAREAPIPYFEGWYVDEEYRGQSVGRQLLRAGEEWAIARGFRELASDATLENEGSIRAHHALGFEELSRTVHFIKRLAPVSRR